MWVWGEFQTDFLWLCPTIREPGLSSIYFVVDTFRRQYILSSIYSVVKIFISILAVANMFCPQNILLSIVFTPKNICYLVADPVAKKSQLVRHCGLGRWPEILSLRLRALGRQDIRTMNPFQRQRAYECLQSKIQFVDGRD